MKKKILAVFLSAVMLLGMLPASIIAGATDGDATDTTTVDTNIYTVMDVPDEDTEIKYNQGTGWGALCMKSGQNYDLDALLNYTGTYYSNTTIYAREINDEGFLIFNPNDATNNVEYNADGTPNTKFGTLSNANIGMSQNKITFRDEPTNSYVGIRDPETKEAVFKDKAAVEHINYIAYRMKIVGGEEGQVSVVADFPEPGYVKDTDGKTNLKGPDGKNIISFNTGGYGGYLYPDGAMYFDPKTGEITEKTDWKNGYMMIDGEFDGWVIIPFDGNSKNLGGTAVPDENGQCSAAYTMCAKYRYLLYGSRFQLFFYNDTRNGVKSDWTGRSLLMGDIKAFADLDTFVNTYTNDPIETPTPVYDDTYNYKGIDGASYFMNVPDDLDDFCLKYDHANASTTSPINYPGAGTLSKFPADDGTYDPDGGNGGGLFVRKIDGETFIEFDKNEAYEGCVNQGLNPDAITYGTKTSTGLHASIDRTNLNYIAMRVKVDELVEGASKKSGFYLYLNGKSIPRTGIKNAYIIDKATGEKSTPDSWKKWNSNSIIFEGEVDGWVVIPIDECWGKDVTFNGNDSGALGFTLYMHNSKDDTTPCHDSAAGVDKFALEGWDDKILYIGDIVLFEDQDTFLCGIGHHEANSVEAVAPSLESAGNIAHYLCSKCNQTFADAECTTPINPYRLAIDAASLTLEQNIAVNFKVTANSIAGFTDVYAKFTFDGKEENVEANAELDDNGKYVFTLDAIGPHNFGKEITAQLFGTYEGNECAGEELVYSVKDYCYNKLDQYADATDKKEFKTLLVDLLNYGAKAQIYSGTDTDALINANLKHFAHQVNLASGVPTLTGGTKGVYDEIEETVTWNGVNLYFEDIVGIKFRFTAPETEGLTVKVMDAKSGGNVLAEITEFVGGANGSSIAYFDGLNATEMRKTVYVAVYDGETQVSEILAYDIVSYAYEKAVAATASDATTAQKNLSFLVSNMIRYGDAAAAYTAANA